MSGCRRLKQMEAFKTPGLFTFASRTEAIKHQSPQNRMEQKPKNPGSQPELPEPRKPFRGIGMAQVGSAAGAVALACYSGSGPQEMGSQAQGWGDGNHGRVHAAVQQLP